MKRKWLVLSFFLSVFLVATFGTAQQQTLDMWSWRTEDVDVYKNILQVYQEAHPDTAVNFEAFLNTEYNTLVATSMQAGDASDVVQTRSYGAITSWIEGGYLLPLDTTTTPTLTNFNQATLDAVSSQKNGQVYGVPFAIQTLQVFYNKAIFADLNLSEPDTWEDFLALNQTLLDNGYIPIAAPGKDTWMLPILHSIVGAGTYGGNDFVDALLRGDTTFEDPRFVASLEAVKDLRSYFPPDITAVSYTDAQLLFTSEMAAMFAGGSWEKAYFVRENPGLDLGVFAIPAKGTNEKLSSWYVDGAWAATTSAENPEAALEFINWLGTPEFGQLFTDNLAQLSPVEGVNPSDPVLQDIVDIYNASSTPYLLLVHFRYGSPFGTDILGQNMQKFFLGQMTAQEVAADLQAKMSSWFTPQPADTSTSPKPANTASRTP